MRKPKRSNVEAQPSRLPELPSLRELKARLSRNRREATALNRLIRIASDLSPVNEQSEVASHA